MRLCYKILLNLSAIVSFLVIFYAFQESRNNYLTLFNYEKTDKKITIHNAMDSHLAYLQNTTTVNWENDKNYNIWCIFCKATSTSPLRYKFSVFLHSLVHLSTVPLNINIISDTNSQVVAQEVLSNVKNTTQKDFKVHFYDAKELADQVSDIIKTMQSHFTSQPDSYYSDVLFFISLGLHRIALNQNRAIMIDVDTKIKTDIKLLFQEFDKFGKETILGIAPELTPVYRHVLYMYRAKYRNTSFGKPLSQSGNPGVNSGVLLLHLSKMRQSDLYNKLLSPQEVNELTKKYMFQGHLGDQDWYTILSQEHKELIYLLDCTWNRQLCQWWSHHGYKDIFNMFYYCPGEVKIYHGNCNTRIP